MKHREYQHAIRAIFITMAATMCLTSFIASEYMDINALRRFDNIAAAVSGGSGSAPYDAMIIHFKQVISTPLHATAYLISLVIYMAPCISLVFLYKWLSAQAISLAAIAATTTYDINATLGSYTYMGNTGCSACETHAFFHFLAVISILLFSAAFLVLYSLGDKYIYAK